MPQSASGFCQVSFPSFFTYSNMSCFRFPSLAVFALLFVTFFLLNEVDGAHKLEKRQIGVLARTGALPQGKRSVEVLARNGELPQPGGKKEQNEGTLDSLIEALQAAESLSKLRAQALTEKLLEERELERYGTDKRSVAALARNGELPQKRLAEIASRSGYLIKPQQEVASPQPDLLDPDDFLAGRQSSMMPEYLDEKAFRPFLELAKRSLGSFESGISLYNKKNLASLARDGGFASLRHPFNKERRVAGFDSADFHDDDKKNGGGLDKREFGNCSGNDVDSGKRRTQDDEEEDFGEAVEKRFLGRIPQLGRMHQKVQSPSSRRRPHLRPNWL